MRQICTNAFEELLAFLSRSPSVQGLRTRYWPPVVQAKSCICNPAQPWLYCASLSYLDLTPKFNAGFSSASLSFPTRPAVNETVGVPTRRLAGSGFKECELDIPSMLRGLGCFSGSCKTPIAPPLITLELGAEMCLPTIQLVSGNLHQCCRCVFQLGEQLPPKQLQLLHAWAPANALFRGWGIVWQFRISGNDTSRQLPCRHCRVTQR